jgi:hypothetical protein
MLTYNVKLLKTAILLSIFKWKVKGQKSSMIPLGIFLLLIYYLKIPRSIVVFNNLTLLKHRVVDVIDRADRIALFLEYPWN